MSIVKDPFEVIVIEEESDDFAALSRKPVAVSSRPAPTALPQAATARFHGFSLDDEPLITGLANLPGEVVTARTTVSLVQAQIGSTVVLLFDQDDVRRPIIVGVLQDRRPVLTEPRGHAVSVQSDDERFVVTAEREIVLRCGQASITLTRAGKVIIKGAYIVSRSSGYNKIKGAAVDIN
jgi:Domain of unknown function (DUF6484)